MPVCNHRLRRINRLMHLNKRLARRVIRKRMRMNRTLTGCPRCFPRSNKLDDTRVRILLKHAEEPPTTLFTGNIWPSNRNNAGF